MHESSRKPVLQDHVRVKSRLVPGFLHTHKDVLSQYSWARQLAPEVIWIGLLIDRFGFNEAAHISEQLCRSVYSLTDLAEPPRVVRFSTFSEISEVAKHKILATLDKAAADALRIALAPLSLVAQDHPLAFLGSEKATNEQEARFPLLISELYDRNSRLSVLSMALGYRLGISQGKIHVAEHLEAKLRQDFKDVENYPGTPASLRAASSFRAAAPMLFMTFDPGGDGYQEISPWAVTFWDRIAGFGPCILPDMLMHEETETEDTLESFVISFRNAVRSDLIDRFSVWPLDLNNVEVFEVVAGLLARHATLAMELAGSPGTWTPHLAPIILRASADVFISLAWILRDPNPRSRRFVEDGQGAVKLQIAHQKAALEITSDPQEAEQLRQIIETWTVWLESQKMEAFVEVNLGSWSGITARKMADEAGIIDFYNNVYQVFSGATHSNWAHVSFFNMVHCENPAHRWHRSATIPSIPMDISWVYLASNHLRKSFDLFDKHMGVELPQRAFDFIIHTLNTADFRADEPTTT